MKFELDHLVEEYASIEQKLQDGEIYSDPKLLKEMMQKKKSPRRRCAVYSVQSTYAESGGSQGNSFKRK